MSKKRSDKYRFHTPIPKLKYDPYKLPKAIDFHLATKNLPLPRAVKSHIQIALGKLNHSKLKRLIKDLKDMRWDALGRKDYKMAAYCKTIQEFTEKYFISVKQQKKV